MLYKLENGSLTRAPKYIIDNGTTYINNADKLREKGYKELVHDTNAVDGSYIVKTTYTEDANNIYEHYEWAKYEETETVQEPTLDERLSAIEKILIVDFGGEEEEVEVLKRFLTIQYRMKRITAQDVANMIKLRRITEEDIPDALKQEVEDMLDAKQDTATDTTATGIDAKSTDAK